MTNLIWHDGALISDTERVFNISSRLRYGDGVFDTMLVSNGKCVFARQHFDRLKRHSQVLNLGFNMSFDAFNEAVQQLLQSNSVNADQRYALNTWVIRGSSHRGLMPSHDTNAEIILKLTPVNSEFPPIHAHLATSVTRNEGSPLSRIKSCNYGDNILAIMEANDHDCNEAVLMNNQGHVTCSSIGNIYIMDGDTIITPPLDDGVIDGTLRKIIIERYGAIEKSISEKMLQNAEEIFMTNSLRGIQFFKTLNGRKLNEKSLNIDKDFHVIS